MKDSSDSVEKHACDLPAKDLYWSLLILTGFPWSFTDDHHFLPAVSFRWPASSPHWEMAKQRSVSCQWNDGPRSGRILIWKRWTSLLFIVNQDHFWNGNPLISMSYNVVYTYIFDTWVNAVFTAKNMKFIYSWYLVSILSTNRSLLQGLYRIEIPVSDFKLLFERSRWMWKRHRMQFMDNSKRELTSTDGKDYREFLEEHLPKGESPWQFWNTDSFAYLDISRKKSRYFRKIFKDKNWSQEKEGWKQALGRLPGVRHSETKMSSTNLDVWQCEWLFSSHKAFFTFRYHSEKTVHFQPSA